MFQAHNLQDFYTAHHDYTPTGTEQAVYLSDNHTALVVHSSTHCKSDIYFTLHLPAEGTANAINFQGLPHLLNRDWFVGVKRAKSYGRKPYTEFIYDSTEGFPNHLNFKSITGADLPTRIKISQSFQQTALTYAQTLNC